MKCPLQNGRLLDLPRPIRYIPNSTDSEYKHNTGREFVKEAGGAVAQSQDESATVTSLIKRNATS
jgi:hypothetical protein